MTLVAFYGWISLTFEELLAIVVPFIEKQNTSMRNVIRELLTATLQFLASGQTYEDLKFSCIISPQLMSTIIPETCWTIYKCLKHYIKEGTYYSQFQKIQLVFLVLNLIHSLSLSKKKIIFSDIILFCYSN